MPELVPVHVLQLIFWRFQYDPFGSLLRTAFIRDRKLPIFVRRDDRDTPFLVDGHGNILPCTLQTIINDTAKRSCQPFYVRSSLYHLRIGIPRRAYRIEISWV